MRARTRAKGRVEEIAWAWVKETAMVWVKETAMVWVRALPRRGAASQWLVYLPYTYRASSAEQSGGAVRGAAAVRHLASKGDVQSIDELVCHNGGGRAQVTHGGDRARGEPSAGLQSAGLRTEVADCQAEVADRSE